MALSNYQIAFNGVTIGGGISWYVVTNVEGLGGTSPLRVQDDNRGYIDGSYSGRDFYDERTVYIDVLVLAGNGKNAQQNYAALQAAFAPQQLGWYVDPTGGTPASSQLQLFQFQLTSDTGTKRMYGRSRGLTTPINPDFTYGYIQCRIQMSFPDPRYYDDTASTYSGNGTTSVSVSNTGWAYSCPVITISSVSATSGYIKDTASGGVEMDFSGLTVGHTLVVDLLQRVIYDNGIPNRTLLSSTYTGWLQLAPSSSTTWSSTIGSMSIAGRNAYV